MFNSGGEILLLALAITVTWMVAWMIAERRTTRSIGEAYQLQTSRAYRQISRLEERLGESHVRPFEQWGMQADTSTVRIIERELKAS